MRNSQLVYAVANQHSRYFCLFSVKASRGAPDSVALLTTPGLVLPDSNRFLLLKGLIIFSLSFNKSTYSLELFLTLPSS